MAVHPGFGSALSDVTLSGDEYRDLLAARDRLQAEVERLRGAVLDIQAECNRCFIVQGVPAAETPTTHGYGKILDIAARSLLASGDAR